MFSTKYLFLIICVWLCFFLYLQARVDARLVGIRAKRAKENAESVEEGKAKAKK